MSKRQIDVVVHRRGEEPFAMENQRDWTQAVHVANVMHRGRHRGEQVLIRVMLRRDVGLAWGRLVTYTMGRRGWTRSSIYQVRTVYDDGTVTTVGLSRPTAVLTTKVGHLSESPPRRSTVTILDPILGSRQIEVNHDKQGSGRAPVEVRETAR